MKNGDYILVIAPPDYPGKKYRNRYCYEHYLVYWQTYGVLPKPNEIIHHKNENKHDNRPSNLEIKPRRKHTSDHGKTKGRTMVELRCPACHKIFVREKRATHLQKTRNQYTCCSRQCVGQFTHLPKNVQAIEISKQFIREFKEFSA